MPSRVLTVAACLAIALLVPRRADARDIGDDAVLIELAPMFGAASAGLGGAAGGRAAFVYRDLFVRAGFLAHEQFTDDDAVTTMDAQFGVMFPATRRFLPTAALGLGTFEARGEFWSVGAGGLFRLTGPLNVSVDVLYRHLGKDAVFVREGLIESQSIVGGYVTLNLIL